MVVDTLVVVVVDQWEQWQQQGKYPTVGGAGARWRAVGGDTIERGLSDSSTSVVQIVCGTHMSQGP